MTSPDPPPEPQRLTGAIQHYAWGDRHYIPHLLGIEPDGQPWAELWFGTHPNGPAVLPDGTPLAERVDDLAYLLKVLSAAEPLSLQAHPDAAQAADGHRRGIFSDPNPKPELLCALTEFEAFCGIRPEAATSALLHEIGASGLAAVVAERGAGVALHGLYRGSIDPGPAIDACDRSDRPEAAWVTRLASIYPTDPSVAATLLLNFVRLQPGEALHLTAGNLHSYLHGSGLELMGASDNVVRGGLTRKHVDVDELLAIVDTTPLSEPVIQPSHGGTLYDLPEAGCALLRIDAGDTHTSAGDEIAIELGSGAWYLPPGARLSPNATTYIAIEHFQR